MGKKSRRREQSKSPPKPKSRPPSKPKRVRKPVSPATNARYHQNRLAKKAQEKAAKEAQEEEEASRRKAEDEAKIEKKRQQNLVCVHRYRSSIKTKMSNTNNEQLAAPKKDMAQCILDGGLDEDAVAFLMLQIEANKDQGLADLDAAELASKDREKSVLQSNEGIANAAYTANLKVANGECLFVFFLLPLPFDSNSTFFILFS